jgi:hypothetical protein
MNDQSWCKKVKATNIWGWREYEPIPGVGICTHEMAIIDCGSEFMLTSLYYLLWWNHFFGHLGIDSMNLFLETTLKDTDNINME